VSRCELNLLLENVILQATQALGWLKPNLV
jgi:hypothetical protein